MTHETETALPADFSQDPAAPPKILIDANGDASAVIRFIATDNDGKKVLPGVPCRLQSMQARPDPNSGVLKTLPGGRLELAPQGADINGTVIGFTQDAEARVISRGDGLTGPITLAFDSLHRGAPVMLYPYWLLGQGDPGD